MTTGISAFVFIYRLKKTGMITYKTPLNLTSTVRPAGATGGHYPENYLTIVNSTLLFRRRSSQPALDATGLVLP